MARGMGGKPIEECWDVFTNNQDTSKASAKHERPGAIPSGLKRRSQKVQIFPAQPRCLRLVRTSNGMIGELVDESPISNDDQNAGGVGIVAGREDLPTASCSPNEPISPLTVTVLRSKRTTMSLHCAAKLLFCLDVLPRGILGLCSNLCAQSRQCG